MLRRNPVAHIERPTVTTGTLRDSLVLLSLLLGQQTPLQPAEIMTDTGAYADIIFGLLWLLGYQL